MSNHSRITLIARPASRLGLDWRQAQDGVLFTESLDVVRHLVRCGTSSVDLDVERFVLDRIATDEELLDLLAITPEDFGGDIVHIRHDGSGYLSASVRGGGRILYRLDCTDIRFYLETHDLVSGRVALNVKKIA